MKHFLFCLAIAMLPSLHLMAQELTVKGFALADNDISAQVQPRKDLNDVNCALIKVQFVGDILDAEGNVIKPLVKKVNETWIYMTQNSRQVKIITKTYLPVMVNFSDYSIPKLEGNRTYILTLVGTQGNSGKPAVKTKPSNIHQNACFKYSPAIATIKIETADDNILFDAQTVQNATGTETVSLPVGKYKYTASALGYATEKGSFTLVQQASKNIHIEMQPQKPVQQKEHAEEPTPNKTYIPANVFRQRFGVRIASQTNMSTSGGIFSLSSKVQNEIVVQSVTSGKPFDKAGIVSDFIIETVNGKNINSLDDLYEFAQEQTITIEGHYPKTAKSKLKEKLGTKPGDSYFKHVSYTVNAQK